MEHYKLMSKDGLKDGIPLVISFFPVAMTFGILAKSTGLSLFETFLFSFLVFAGASQFMALGLIKAGVGVSEIIITTLLVNFRHFLMSASFSTKITGDMRKYIPMIAFGITDEFFSIASFTEKKLTKGYILMLQYTSYASWVIGSVTGYVLGEILPEIVKISMGIGLYALFVGILIPEAKKSKKILILAISSGVLNTIISSLNIFSEGWSIIISIVVTSLVGVFITGRDDHE